MTETAPRCYREPTNGVRFVRAAHHATCDEGDCRGCRPCPERHCRSRPNCSWHVSEDEATCGRCLSTARLDLRWIGDLTPLMSVQALGDGAESQAANLAGPAADARTWRGIRLARQRYLTTYLLADRITEEQAARAMLHLEDDDPHHPERVLSTWALMVAEDYGHPLPERMTLAWCVAYLDRQLHRLAHDEAQDFPLLRRELRKCRQHLEAVLHNDDRPDRGIPCPDCTSPTAGVGPRLVRVYGHWCDDEDCRRQWHHTDEGGDVWRCPRNASHEWTHKAYTERLEERTVGA